jgi:HSP20 family molecular chaperone IbpA
MLRLTIIAILLTTCLCSKDESVGVSSRSSTNNDGKEVISTPTYNDAQSMMNDIKEMMHEFSSHMQTSLYDPFFFTRRRLPSADGSSGSTTVDNHKAFSSWDPFSSIMTRWSPRYEVLDDENSFEIKMDVPGFHFHEMSVELEGGGRVLSISGVKEENVEKGWGVDGDGETESIRGEHPTKDEKEAKAGTMKFASHTSTSFNQKFTLDPSVDATKLTANLVDGVLVVRAPRKQQQIAHKKHIPITQFDEDVWAELIAGEIGGSTDEVVREK